MNKLYLVGITQNRLSDIKEITKDIYPYIDGLVWTDHFSTDGTFELLEERKGDGFIYQKFYTKDHDDSANFYLRSGHIKYGDWCVILDSSDKIQPVFLKNLRENIFYWNKNRISTIILDRPFIFRYTGHQHFSFTPHWGLTGLLPGIVNLSQISGYRKENYLINQRNVNSGGIEHPIKYFIEFLRSNQCELLYSQFGHDVQNWHEFNRIQFQINVIEQLKIPLKVEFLTNFISDGIKNKNLPDWLIEYINLEVNLQDLVRYYILKQDFFTEICDNRFDWSFKKFYYEGIEHQGKNDGYIGPFNQYSQKIGKPMQ